MKPSKENRLLIISAPSGAGKSTLVNHLLSSGLPLSFSVSVTSRKPRRSEKEGREYYFITAGEFRKKINAGDLVEWEEVYKAHFYGTLRSEIERIHSSGKVVLFDVDVRGGINLKKIFGHEALSIFIMPPSVEELEKRLVTRGTDGPEKIKMRIEKASSEIKLADMFDNVIINDDLEKACSDILKVVTSFLAE
ncbi:MAG: guanylate kinase [Bacteroidales bacterium]|nr:guanylate kinase [Bacteroidales bacterium]